MNSSRSTCSAHGEPRPQRLSFSKPVEISNSWIHVMPLTKQGAPAQGVSVRITDETGRTQKRVIHAGRFCGGNKVLHVHHRLHSHMGRIPGRGDGGIPRPLFPCEGVETREQEGSIVLLLLSQCMLQICYKVNIFAAWSPFHILDWVSFEDLSTCMSRGQMGLRLLYKELRPKKF